MPFINPTVDNLVTVTLERGGAVYPIPSGAAVTARFYTPDGVDALTPLVTGTANTDQADWPSGIAAFEFSASQTSAITAFSAQLRVFVLVDGEEEEWTVLFEMDTSGSRLALFSDRLTTIASLRTQLASTGLVGDIDDASLWQSLRAAEADAQRRLRVFLQPTVIVPDDAPLSEIQALEAAGTAYATEAAYDYDPHIFQGEAWGFVALRQKPLISIQSMQFAYPTPNQTVFDVPASWIRLDKKYAHLQLVPVGMTVLAPLSAMMLGTISGGRSMPMLVRIRYTAGLSNPALAYPDLVDATKKLAAFKILQGAFLPQSGSISADGLSQSSSIDFDKWMHGPGGIDATFDKLYEAIHGPRLAVLG